MLGHLAQTQCVLLSLSSLVAPVFCRVPEHNTMSQWSLKQAALTSSYTYHQVQRIWAQALYLQSGMSPVHAAMQHGMRCA